MGYYESKRAARVVGIPEPSKVTLSRGGRLSAMIAAVGSEAHRTTTTSRTETFAESVYTFIAQQVAGGREIAHSLYDAVEVTQLMDVTIDVEAGTMPFLRIPGGQRHNDIRAFWATAHETHEFPMVTSRLVLLGSLDGVVGRAVTASESQLPDFSYPSDPGALTGHVVDALMLGIARDEYAYEMAWDGDPLPGEPAEAAWEMSIRARPRSAAGNSWVTKYLPRQRVIATTSDIWTSKDGRERVVLARPILIDSTV